MDSKQPTQTRSVWDCQSGLPRVKRPGVVVPGVSMGRPWQSAVPFPFGIQSYLHYRSVMVHRWSSSTRTHPPGRTGRRVTGSWDPRPSPAPVGRHGQEVRGSPEKLFWEGSGGTPSFTRTGQDLRMKQVHHSVPGKLEGYKMFKILSIILVVMVEVDGMAPLA